MNNLQNIIDILRYNHFTTAEAGVLWQIIATRTLSEDVTTAYAIMASKPGEHETITARRAQIEGDLKTLELAHVNH